MKTASLGFFSLLFFLSSGCDSSADPESYLETIDSGTYYSSEILDGEAQDIYGLWKIYDVSGGFAGSGHEPEFDLLEIKQFGVYGLVKGNELIEYGRIDAEVFDPSNEDMLQIRMIPEFPSAESLLMNPPEKYIQFRGTDSLDLNAPCCDMYNYHYLRIR